MPLIRQFEKYPMPPPSPISLGMRNHQGEVISHIYATRTNHCTWEVDLEPSIRVHAGLVVRLKAVDTNERVEGVVGYIVKGDRYWATFRVRTDDGEQQLLRVPWAWCWCITTQEWIHKLCRWLRPRTAPLPIPQTGIRVFQEARVSSQEEEWLYVERGSSEERVRAQSHQRRKSLGKV